MATVTFQIASAPLTASKVFTGTDADMQNILNWAKVAYAGIINELFNTPPVGGFVPTNAQIGAALATGTMRAWQQSETKFRNDNNLGAVAPPPPNTFGSLSPNAIAATMLTAAAGSKLIRNRETTRRDVLSRFGE